MELLKDAIGSSLRKGDAYTRYGSRHYILLLTKINKESCSIIFQRIESACNKGPGPPGRAVVPCGHVPETEKIMFCVIHRKMGKCTGCGRMQDTPFDKINIKERCPGLRKI